MRKYLRYLIVVLLALITTIAINLNLDMNLGIYESMTGNNIIYIMLFLMLSVIINEVIKIKDKRLIICSFIISILFALFEIIGYSINNSMDLSYIILSKNTFIKSFIKLIGMFNIIYISIIILYKKIIPYINDIKDKEIKLFKIEKKNFFIIWGIIFLFWLPYLLKYFPGIVTPDSMDQIYQSQGINILTNHHPAFHTFCIAIAMGIGKIFNNYNIGLAVYSVVQMIALSGVFSYTIRYMSKYKVNNIIKIITLLFYALYPVFGLYSITMWKDIPFAIVMLLFIIKISELVQDNEEFLKSKGKITSLIITMMLVIAFRNNGIYIVILTIPFLLWFYRKNWKKMLTISIIPVLFYIIYTGPIFSILNIKKGSIREALTIPLQQFVRIEKDRGSELTDIQKEKIHKFLPVDNLTSLYNPTISDPVKSRFDEEYFKENKIEFVCLYIELAFSYPVETIEAFLCNNYGYWYPEASNWVVSRAITDNELNLTANPITENAITNLADSFIDKRDIPVISMVLSIGFMFWLNIISLTYTIYKKEYKKILIYIPILAMWLTTIASPVFCEYRYVFSMVVSLPVIISIFNLAKKE